MERGRFAYRRGRPRGGGDYPGHGHAVQESPGREVREPSLGHGQNRDDLREEPRRNRSPDCYEGYRPYSDEPHGQYHRNRSPDYYERYDRYSGYHMRHSDRSPDRYYGRRCYSDRSPDRYYERRHRNRSPEYYEGRHEYTRNRSPDFYERRSTYSRNRSPDFYERRYRGQEVVKKPDFYAGYSRDCREHQSEQDVMSYSLRQNETTTKEEDETIIETLMKIYDDCRPEVIRASVEHPENRVKPFDKSVLMERCLLDLRTRSTWRRRKPSAALGAPVQGTSAPSVSTQPTREPTSSGQRKTSALVSAHDASKVRKPEKSTSVSSTDNLKSSRSETTKEREPKLKEKQPVSSTGSHSRSTSTQKSVSTDKSKKVPKDQSSKPVPSTGSQRSESKKRETEEPFIKVTHQKKPKYERYVSQREYNQRFKSGSSSQGSRSYPSSGAVQKRGKTTCFMEGCKVTSTSIKKHVMGRHLPTEAYGRTGDLEREI